MKNMSPSISLLALLNMGARIQIGNILLIGNPTRSIFDIRRDDLLFGIYELTYEGFNQGMEDLERYPKIQHTGFYCPASDDHECRRSDCVGAVCGLYRAQGVD